MGSKYNAIHEHIIDDDDHQIEFEKEREREREDEYDEEGRRGRGTNERKINPDKKERGGAGGW